MAIKNNKSKNHALSKSNDKRSELLIKVDNLMEQIDNNYGPFLLDELNNRLEKTIEKFNDDLKLVLEESFKNHESKKERMDSVFSNSSNDSSVPTFIADYEKKVENKKNK